MFGSRQGQLNVSVCGQTLRHISNVGKGWIRSSDVTICCYGHEWPYPEIIFTASWTSETGRIAIDSIEVNVPTATSADALNEETYYCKKLTTRSPSTSSTASEATSEAILVTTPITASERTSLGPTTSIITMITSTDKVTPTSSGNASNSDRPFSFAMFAEFARDNLYLVIIIGIAVVAGFACPVVVYLCLRTRKEKKNKNCATNAESPAVKTSSEFEESPYQELYAPPKLPPKKMRKEKIMPSTEAGAEDYSEILF
ncbi:uncharacterized protein [Diadema antillarum]|uniref:uncharacterized protein n=1 Tax=Diadema antillarum TaxID=105358 RepID=UPI003A8A03A8